MIFRDIFNTPRIQCKYTKGKQWNKGEPWESILNPLWTVVVKLHPILWGLCKLWAIDQNTIAKHLFDIETVIRINLDISFYNFFVVRIRMTRGINKECGRQLKIIFCIFYVCAYAITRPIIFYYPYALQHTEHAHLRRQTKNNTLDRIRMNNTNFDKLWFVYILW